MSRLLEVERLRVEYAAGRMRRTLVSDVSLHVDRGETIAIVGESGSGKTLTARAIIRLLPTGVEATAKRMALDGADILSLNAREAGVLRGNRISLILQDAFTMVSRVGRCGGSLE